MDLFVYGTLMVPQVMRTVCGYTASGVPAVLHEHCCRLVRDEIYPGIYPCKNDDVEGLLYRDVDAGQLRLLDRFESDMYQRLQVTVSLAGGECVAHAYVVRESARHLLTDLRWDRQSFLRDGLQRFVGGYAGFSAAED